MGRYEVHQSDGNAEQLYGFLRGHGATVVVIHRPVDCAVGAYGVTALAEVKQPKGKLEPSQMAFLSEWRGLCVVLRTEADCLELLATMREMAR